MSARRTRIYVALGSTIVFGAAAGWCAVKLGRGHDSVRLVDRSAAIQQMLVERRATHADASTPAERGFADIALVREPISAEQAQLLFPIDERYYEYDPQVYYRYKGGMDGVQEWGEYPGGSFVRKTSSEGYREDFDRLPEKRDVFVVVTGDSHTDGLCTNRESFANLAEAELARRHPGRAVEVLNTGVSGYSFYNYLGALEKHLPLSPQAFVVAFYGGNDFHDMILLWHFFHHTSPPPRRSDYWERLDAATRVSSSVVALVLNQVLYFQYHPDQADIGLEATIQVSARIKQLCDQHHVQLIYVYIPPGIDVDGELKPMLARAKEVLDLSTYDLQQYNHLADKLIARVRGWGVDVIDLREHFREPIDRYYWGDLHLNLKGHALVSELLVPRLETLDALR
jgi:lysophospholipase L1-like esterase